MNLDNCQDLKKEKKTKETKPEKNKNKTKQKNLKINKLFLILTSSMAYIPKLAHAICCLVYQSKSHMINNATQNLSQIPIQ